MECVECKLEVAIEDKVFISCKKGDYLKMLVCHRDCLEFVKEKLMQRSKKIKYSILNRDIKNKRIDSPLTIGNYMKKGQRKISILL